jgi:uncharacterized membrane protein (UPF0127 family)
MTKDKLRLRRVGDDTVICDTLVMGESFWQRFVGLMGRASMPVREGLYLPANSIHMMFMRFPIDALFVSKEDGEGLRSVVRLRPELPAWRGVVMPVRGAEGVIEMPAGTLERLGVMEGDRVVFEPVPMATEVAAAK